MSNLTICAPLNNVSFGQVALAILREFYSRGLSPNIFPIGPIDYSSQVRDEKFDQWVKTCIEKAPKSHGKNGTTLKLWHLNGGMDFPVSKKNVLLTFHELSELTQNEINVVNNIDEVFVTSKYTQDVFLMSGLEHDRVSYIPLGFDSHNFKPVSRSKIPGVTQWGLFGKAEKRKHTYRQLRLWAKKYGNNRAHRLNVSISNIHLKPEDQNALISRALEGKSYNNINFLPFFPRNEDYNKVLQSVDIVLACSGAEGYGLPEFHATALGAWPVVLDAHVYKDHFNEKNAVLIQPSGMELAYDNIFFYNGAPYNQGSIFSFSDEEFYKGCEQALERSKRGLNTEGMKLQEMTYKRTVDAIIERL
jgi:glycosyltransferase involved in cell wall biosynthesis